MDHPGSRGFWYYVALVSDSCGNLCSASNRTAGTLDYLLGDVSDGATPGTGNNSVGLEDVTLLGANYGISGATIAARGRRVPRRRADDRPLRSPRDPCPTGASTSTT